MTASEFNGAMLDRVRRVTAAIEEISSRPVAPVPVVERDVDILYDAMVTEPGLRTATKRLFRNAHYAEAVRHGCMHVNNTIKKRTRIAKDGADLMNHAFGLPNPTLRINAGKTVSDRDEQEGYRLIFGGVMWGLRNPRAHEPVEDDPDAALEMLIMANHLMRVFGRAKRPRRKAA